MRWINEGGGAKRLDMSDAERIAHYNIDHRLAPFARYFLNGTMNERDFLVIKDALNRSDRNHFRKERAVLAGRIISFFIIAIIIGLMITIVT